LRIWRYKPFLVRKLESEKYKVKSSVQRPEGMTTPDPSEGGEFERAKDKHLHKQKVPLGDLGVK